LSFWDRVDVESFILVVEPFYVIGLPLRFSSPVVVRPYELKWFDVELPDPGPYEVVYRNRACLICESDLHLYKGLHPFAPLPACCGHEVAADVVEVGSEVSDLVEGDRVYVSGTGSSPGTSYPSPQPTHPSSKASRRPPNGSSGTPPNPWAAATAATTAGSSSATGNPSLATASAGKASTPPTNASRSRTS